MIRTTTRSHLIALIVLLLARDSSSRGGDLPVGFVPGLGGTRLVEVKADGTERPVWVAPSLMNAGRMDVLRLTEDGLDRPEVKIRPGDALLALRLRSILEMRISDPDFPAPEDEFRTRDLLEIARFPIPVYGGFKAWADRTWPGPGRFSIVSYDWRKGAGPESDAAIDAAVKSAMATTGESRVVLVAHSLGGLAARHYLHDPARAGRVRALITAGTAWMGAPKPARALRYGYCFGLGGRVGLSDEQMIKGIYIYRREAEADSYDEIRYLSLVSLVDLAKSRELALTLPCVFQLLPTADYLASYGAAVGGGGPRSIFVDQAPKATLDGFAAANPKLMAAAKVALGKVLDGDAHGVRQTIIAGTLDPGIAPEFAMDLRMGSDADPSFSWVGVDLRTAEDKGEKRSTFRDLADKALQAKYLLPGPAATSGFWALLKAKRYRPDRRVAEAFFSLSPALRDFGNYNWHLLRTLSVDQARVQKGLPLYIDPYIAVHTDARPLHAPADARPDRWGDGATPLLSATFGTRAKTPAGERSSTTLADSPIGKGVGVEIVPLGKDLEHSQMLDDKGVQEAILKAYRAAATAHNMVPR